MKTSIFFHTQRAACFPAICLACTVLLATASCNSDEPSDTPSRLTLSSRMDRPVSRATVNNTWDGGEQVQVSINAAAAVTFIAADDGTLTSDTGVYWQDHSSGISASAWYPAAWTMQVDQSATVHFRATDFLFAPTVSGITQTTISANPLVFYHRTAKITATLTTGPGIGNPGVATVAFYGHTSGTANVVTGDLTGSDGGWIKPLANGDNSHTALLIPQDVSGMPFIKVTLGGTSYLYTPNGTDGLLEAGKAYLYQITVTHAGLTVTCQAGVNWDAGAVENVVSTPYSPSRIYADGVGSGAGVVVTFTDNSTESLTLDGSASCELSFNNAYKTVKSIAVGGGTPVLIGRKNDGSDIRLKFDGGGNLLLRDAVSGAIPVGSYAEFQLINTDNTTLAGAYRQEADLDLMNEEWRPVGYALSSSNMVPFTGAFDGGGYTLSNLSITTTNNKQGIGLFGVLNAPSLSNIHIASGSISEGGMGVGGVCGMIVTSGSITGCSNAADISGGMVGGICGMSAGVGAITITACYNTGSISTANGLTGGGICGIALGTTIADCYNTGSISGTGTGLSSVGGVCGQNAGTVTSCHNTGSVSVAFGDGGYVGGVCGHNQGSITACYNTGIVSAPGIGKFVGGVCGYNQGSTAIITACYNTVSVSSPGGSTGLVGGVCGRNHGGTLIACYNTGSVSVIGSGANVGGVCGQNMGTTVITACYWLDVPGDYAAYGIGDPAGNTDATPFGSAAWPSVADHAEWGTGNGSGSGAYWLSLGGWNAGTPTFPKLWYE
jgi:hypothetical protein